MGNDAFRVAQNIRNLRNAYGETQKELAQAIGVSHNAVSLYESGTRQPDIQKIQAIALHYGFPADRIVNEDLSGLDFTSIRLSKETSVAWIKKMFPILYSEKALENRSFMEGYRITKSIQNTLAKLSPNVRGLSGSFERALEFYATAFEECSETPEVAANMLWLLFTQYALLPDEHFENIGKAIIEGRGQGTSFLKKFVLRDSNPTTEQNFAGKKAYVKQYNEVIVDLLRVLKESKEYSDFADYYTALRFVYGIVDNEHSEDLNQTIGMAMMLSFAELGNDYALQFLRFGWQVAGKQAFE